MMGKNCCGHFDEKLILDILLHAATLTAVLPTIYPTSNFL
jgi:hypothetical protein